MTNLADQPKSPTMPIQSATAFTPRSCEAKNDGFPRHKSAGKSLRLLIGLFVFCAVTANAQTYQELVDFISINGCCPKYPAIMAQGRDGNLYGTTPTGGVNNVGIVFKITPSGSQTILHQFDTTHGSTPNGGLVLGNDGNFYGTTQLGGAHAYGNIFKITPSGVLTVLYDFTGNADGGYPVAPLVLATDGNFYGTSYPGVAFKFSPSGTFTIINKIPTVSYGPLLQASDGNFYDVTEFGGTFSAGTVYKIVGSTVTTLYNFDGTHGSFPIGGLVQGADGNLYGTTTAGGTTNAGVIFRITTAGTLTVLVDFDGVHTLNGYQAFAGLVAGSDGNLYGATIWGGTSGYGEIFQTTTAGAYTALYNFVAPSGDGAYSTPMQHTNGRIFGLTTRGGVDGKGGIYSYDSGISPFVSLVSTLGPVGATVGILGNGFTGTTQVQFNGTTASFRVLSDTYLTATVPSGETGFVTVTTSSGRLLSNKVYRVTPKITSIAPASGTVGTSVVIKGTGLIQATTITLGGVKVNAFTVNSDQQVTFTVPTGAKTGKVVLTTPGGKATSSSVFTVTP
jgi:uncharacterized repeat protein (TIGR03803 family)